MMGLKEINRINAETAEQAEAEGKTPLHFETEMQIRRKEFSLPNLGPYVPEGYERTEREPMFVDKSGFGSPSEPALTVDEFINLLLVRFRKYPEYGYAVIEEGPFQVYVGEFRKVRD